MWARIANPSYRNFGWADGVKDRVETVVNTAKAQKEEPKAVKNDTTEVLYYGGKNYSLQRTEKSVYGKIVKIEKND